LSPIQLARLLPLDLPQGAELISALAELAARTGASSVSAAGELDDVLLDAPEPRTLTGRWTLLSLQGFVGPQGGPWALLARATDAGPQLTGGRIAQATVVTIAGQALAPVSAERLASDGPAPAPAPPGPSPSPSQPSQPAQGASPSQPGQAPPYASALPKRPERPHAEVEVYPEEGDVVTHFHFGRCVVISSDGERIRLQHEGDSKVREVALSMLKIPPPTTLDDGRRHFELLRKH
jgi:hypothetical protein